MEKEMLKNIFFDLDGTLLPMDMKKFVEIYLKSMCQAVCPYIKLSPEVLEKAVLAGFNEIYQNKSAITNKMKFWNGLAKVAGPDIINEIPVFNGYYNNEFILTKEATDKNSLAFDAVSILKNKGYNLVLATNPLFPKVATERRIKWAGIDKEDFSFITTYETSKYCKPDPEYFQETCSLADCIPEETLMVGNDVDEDMNAEKIGMKTYLVKDFLVNRSNSDYSRFQQGSFRDFYSFCVSLPDIRQ
jgi:FMN phosphatase YigB (HAD superfamily)